MGSFKLKLVLWFAFLALLPLAVAFVGYDTLARRSETRGVDAGLEATLRAAAAGYRSTLDRTGFAARQLATDPALQRALRGHDRQTIVRLVARSPGTSVDGPGLHVGRSTGVAVHRIQVVERGNVLGRVTASVSPAGLLKSLRGPAASPDERLVVVQSGRVIAGFAAGSRVELTTVGASRVRLAGTEYRGLRTAPLGGQDGLELAAIVPQHRIDAAVRSAEGRILAALLASLVLFAVITYLLGRSIVRTLRRLSDAANAIAAGRFGARVDVQGRDEFAQLGVAFNDMAAQLEQRLVELETERSRVRDAAARFGGALAATHDPGQLMRVIVNSAVEASGAEGGIVISGAGELARAGDPDAAGERIAFPLRAGGSDFGSLVLTAYSFDADQVEMAASLAAHAVVALDNARLHRIVERQALVDSLTGLANRRSLEETLRSELARAVRFNDHICLVLADLDDFKQVNDRYGHPAGDEVLKEFAEALRATVRESDVAGRWGGEEFALVLTGADAAGGARLAERAREMIEARRLLAPDGSELTVTASFGVASFPEVRELGDLLAAADSALYAAKRDGKNRVVVAVESANPKMV
jgi:diguanylate cyclase (GGDEF)-like protein